VTPSVAAPGVTHLSDATGYAELLLLMMTTMMTYIPGTWWHDFTNWKASACTRQTCKTPPAERNCSMRSRRNFLRYCTSIMQADDQAIRPAWSFDLDVDLE